ncbi:MAG: glycoside hydrolase, partial [Frankia sp.]|nr:glycoside hydrolase [Frankia sp.]
MIRRRRLVLAAPLLALAVLTTAPRVGPAAHAADALTCATGRTTVHTAGGHRQRAPRGVRPVVACLSRTAHIAFEPTLGISSHGAVFYIAEDLPLGPHVLKSVDAGHSWAVLSRVTQPSAVGDPYLYVDPATDRVFAAALKSDLCTEVAVSDDAGATWITNPAVCGQVDHETLFAGRPVSSALVGYPKLVYMCAITGGVATLGTAVGCMKSVTGGATFVPTGQLPFPPRTDCVSGGSGHGVVGPDGAVYLPKGLCGQPLLAISHDEGATWSQVLVSAVAMSPDDHESAVAVDAKGNLYYAWVGSDTRLYLAISRTGGRTWGRPMMISPPGLYSASFPGIDVRLPGKIALDFMGEWSNDALWHGFVTTTSTALATSPVFWTTEVNPRGDPLVHGACPDSSGVRCDGAGDFFDVAIAPDGTTWAAFVDACSATCARNYTQNDAEEGVAAHIIGGP